MPNTIVQKMTGAIIILMRLTNMVPSTPRSLPTPGATSPTTTPAITAMMTPMYSQWVRSRLVLDGVSAVSSGVVTMGSEPSPAGESPDLPRMFIGDSLLVHLGQQ